MDLLRRTHLAAWIGRIHQSSPSSSGRLLVMGQHMEGLEHADGCRELVHLAPTVPEDAPWSDRFRFEPWPNFPEIPFADQSFSSVLYVAPPFPARGARLPDLLREAGRVAANAVVMLAPFASESVSRSLEGLRRLRYDLGIPDVGPPDEDLPEELPDLDAVRRSLGDHFSSVLVEPVTPLREWMLLETSSWTDRLSPADVGRVGSFWQAWTAGPGRQEGAYDHVVVASRSEPRSTEATARADDRLVFLSILQQIEGRLRDEMRRLVDRGLSTRLDERQKLTRLSDELRDLEVEGEDLRLENESLKTDRENLERLLAEAVGRADRLQAWIDVVESTRGWKLLEIVRHLRSKLTRR